MRLKLAEVLVDYGQGIAKFVDYSDQGSDIYRSHRLLWKISVYAHPKVTRSQRADLLVSLARQMGLCWTPAPGDLGSRPDEWPDRRAALLLVDDGVLPIRHVERLVAAAREAAARGDRTQTDAAQRIEELRAIAEAENWLIESTPDEPAPSDGPDV
jgi:hypothetical protein